MADINVWDRVTGTSERKALRFCAIRDLGQHARSEPGRVRKSSINLMLPLAVQFWTAKWQPSGDARAWIWPETPGLSHPRLLTA
jgi:hypothetical protein